MIIANLESAILNFSLNFEGPTWLLIVAIILSVFFSYFIYKQTLPPVNRLLRRLLFFIRSLALIVIILLLFHPIISIRHKYVQKPDIAVLIDKSRSLQIIDSNVSRFSIVNSIIRDDIWEKLKENFSVHFLPFSSSLDTTFSIENNDTLQFNGEGTDISHALDMAKNRLRDNFFPGAIVISDGMYNMGENPEFMAQRFNLPIHTIGVGDPAEKKDILVTQVITNDIVYTNNRIPVDVTISQVGFTDKKLQVFLKKDGEIIDQQVLTLAGENQGHHIKLFYLADQPGFQKFQVEIPALTGEFTKRNNSRSFIVKILDSKVKLLLLAGEPGLDFKFLRRALEADDNIELNYLVQKKNGGAYTQTGLNAIIQEDYQLYIFLGFPRWPIPAALSSYLSDKLIGQKKPLLFLEGANLNISALRNFIDILPFEIRQQPGSPREVVVDPTFLGQDSPVIMLHENRTENRQNWNDLPPIYTYMSNFTPFADSDVLLQIHPALSKLPSTDNYRKPILISRQLGDQKILAFLGQGLWRWDFMMWGVGKSNNMLLTFLERAVRWLITRDEERRVKISTDKFIYRSGGQVYVQAQVYTEDYRPVEDVSVKLQVNYQNEVQDYHLESIGNGKYQTQFRVFQGGDYSFFGEAYKGEKFFGADTGKFSVGEFDVEFQQTRMNETLLSKVSQISGGKYFTPQNFREIVDVLPVENRQQVRLQEINLWNEWLALVIFISLLALEWIIRRRKGML